METGGQTKTVSHSIALEFTRTPGPRFRKEGDWSGQEFRETKLGEWFEEAKAAGVKLVIDFDGGYGYAPSFLEEAFGGLARIHGSGPVQEILELKSEEDPYLVGRVRKSISQAND
jgi:hypothetical protein